MCSSTQKQKLKTFSEFMLFQKHWPDDDMYTLQLDGQSRDEAEAYDIYDSHWDVQLVENGQLKPTPTRILTVLRICLLQIHATKCGKCTHTHI